MMDDNHKHEWQYADIMWDRTLIFVCICGHRKRVKEKDFVEGAE